jgi:hypothetical protein
MCASAAKHALSLGLTVKYGAYCASLGRFSFGESVHVRFGNPKRQGGRRHGQ